jgi:hypothetical protein
MLRNHQRSRFKIYGMTLAMICVIALPGSAQTVDMGKRGLPGNGIILISLAQKNSVAPGEQNTLRLRMYNEGQQPQNFIAAWPLAVFSLIVEDEDGHLVSQIKKLGPGVHGGSLTTGQLAPNHETFTEYPLSQMYDLSHIGAYRITAMRKILTPDNKDTIDVVSNTVILHVSDRLSKEFTLMSASSQLSVTQGEPVDAQFILRNNSTVAAPLILAGPACGYTLEMQDFHGELVPPKLGVVMDNPPTTRVMLPPGERIDCTLRLSDIYDFSKAGRYFVTAMRKVPAAGGEMAQVYSPTVLITVTPPHYDNVR